MSKSLTTLIKQALIKDPESPFNNQVCDILIENGMISGIASQIESAFSTIIEAKGLSISPGAFDLQVQCGVPGDEEKETFESLSKLGIHGGTTGMLVMPANHPPSDNRGQLEYRAKLGKAYPVDFQFAGFLSKKGEGKQLSELVDMAQGGAIAFTDDKLPSDYSILLHLAMQYASLSGGVLMFHPEDSSLRLGGQVHEGERSMSLGLKGSPAIAEEIGLARIIALAGYHQKKIHVSGISTAKSIEQIERARKEGIDISCSVYIHNLYFSDDDLVDFDSQFKVWPPLRTQSDRNALLEAVRSGTINIICSDHRPETVENKDVEFDYASFGMSNAQSLWQASFSLFGSDDIWIERVCHAPRKLLGLPSKAIELGNLAELVIYNSTEEYTLSADQNLSLSKYNAFIGRTLNGKIEGVYTNNSWFPRS